jgi:methionine aminotransferase
MVAKETRHLILMALLSVAEMDEYSGQLPSKMPHAGTTIFTVMSALAAEHQAINLSQGFPDFDVSEELIDLVHQMMKRGYNQYAPMPGIRPLREMIAQKVRKRYSARMDPDAEITITAGGTQAIFTAITAMVQTGDEVILFDPAYDCYAPAIELCGGIPVRLQLTPPAFSIDWEQVKRAINARTRMILINTPHNPTGSILTTRDMQQLEKITRHTDIIILSDEVYEHIIFDGAEHESILRFPALAARSFVVFSFGKTFHATGWKCGYVLAPAPLMAEFRKVHQFNVFSVNTPLQYALAVFMEDEKNYAGIETMYQEKRNRFLNLMKPSRFKPLPCHGSYFLLFDYSDISDEPDTAFARRLTMEYKVASIPVSVFYQQPPEYRLLRFCFAKKDETLQMAAERLCQV